jgi:NAD(P)-dependent dehydrogenase (short-subunit alcohol dehydrogenase family)
VNAIVCGTFHTDSLHASIPTEELQGQMASNVSLGRIADAHEIVGTALFLASDASSYLTGELISLDGG